jgi:hypothetical protein
MVVTCIWSSFNSIIVQVTHLFEIKFESIYNTIVKDNVKDNKLRSRVTVTCQPRVMKQILDGCCWLLTYFWLQQFQTSLCCIAGFIIVSASRGEESVFGWYPYCKWSGPTRSTQTMIKGSDAKSCYFGWEQPIFLKLLLCHLTYFTSVT